MTDASPATGQRSTRRATVSGIAVALVLIALATGLLHWRASAESSVTHSAPMPVATTLYQVQERFEHSRRFLGLVEAGKRADLGFESAGLLAEITVNEGTKVAAGDVLARLDERRLQARRNAAAADLDTLSANLELAHLKARRQENLQASGAVSREAYDETRLRAKALTAQQKAVEAQLESLDIELSRLTLHAPFEGVIAARYLDPGSVTAAGAPVLRLIQSRHREARIGVSVELLAELSPGTVYTLSWRGQTLPAPLRSVRPDIDPNTRTAIAVFALPYDTPALDGEAITLELAYPVNQPGGWLPLSALLEGQRGIWNVLAVQERNGQWITTREVVEILELRAGQAYVRGTLADGQTVVADGIHRIAPGSPVTPLAP